MKEFYVDKLPTDCQSCRLCKDYNFDTRECRISCSFMSIRESVLGRMKNCPLKQLTNAQLAIGWVFENPHNVYNKFTGKSFSIESNESKLYSFSQFHNTSWELRKPQYTFTDWKGAREASREGTKVTFEDFELVFDRLVGYKLIRNGYKYTLYDEHFDSKEWKIWE